MRMSSNERMSVLWNGFFMNIYLVVIQFRNVIENCDYLYLKCRSQNIGIQFQYKRAQRNILGIPITLNT